MNIDQHFQSLRSRLELNPTKQGLVSMHYNAIKSKINALDKGYEVKLIGSLQRRTRIHPKVASKFDIDILVIKGTFYSWANPGEGITSKDALLSLKKEIVQSERYSSYKPSIDAPTISFTYDDGIHVEIVPAYKDEIGYNSKGVSHVKGRSYWVATEEGWKIADYDYEAQLLSQINSSCSYLIPIIKQLKLIRSQHFDGTGIDSIHFEILATKIIPYLFNNSLFGNYRDRHYLEGLFKYASAFIKEPLNFEGSNADHRTIHYLDQIYINSKFSELLNLIKRANSENISYKEQISIWTEIFGDYFPQQVYE